MIAGVALLCGASYVLFRYGQENLGNGWRFLYDIGPFIVIFGFGFLLVGFALPRRWLRRMVGIVGEGSDG